MNTTPVSAAKPAKPVVTALLLTTAAVLSFRATTRDRSGSTLGVLVDATGTALHLTIAASAPNEGDGTWTLSGELPRGTKPVLLYESAANVLRGGTYNTDGTIAYQGGMYLIESLFDGKGWTAKIRGTA